MSISERTLRKWRREALKDIKRAKEFPENTFKDEVEARNRILRMTQELLDQHLLRK